MVSRTSFLGCQEPNCERVLSVARRQNGRDKGQNIIRRKNRLKLKTSKPVTTRIIRFCRRAMQMQKVLTGAADNILIAPPSNPHVRIGWAAIKKNWETYWSTFDKYVFQCVSRR
jgi:hypothetical protein